MEENKKKEICPRCNKEFQCVSEDIVVCPCQTIQISEAVSQFISEKYKTCLCLDCLLQLEQEYNKN